MCVLAVGCVTVTLWDRGGGMCGQRELQGPWVLSDFLDRGTSVRGGDVAGAMVGKEML